MFTSALVLASALTLALGTDGAAVAELPVAAVPSVTPAQPAASRPAFTLGAGDALGARIRVNDIILARRLEAERVQFATVPDQD